MSDINENNWKTALVNKMPSWLIALVLLGIFVLLILSYIRNAPFTLGDYKIGIGKETTTEAINHKLSTINLLRLDHPQEVFSLEYPSTLKNPSFKDFPGAKSLYIGVSPPKNNQLVIPPYRYSGPSFMMVAVLHKDRINKELYNYFLGNEKKYEENASLENGFISKKSRFITRHVHGRGIGSLFIMGKVATLIDYSDEYLLISYAFIMKDDWDENETAWRASFKSLKIDPNAAKRVYGSLTSSNNEQSI